MTHLPPPTNSVMAPSCERYLGAGIVMCDARIIVAVLLQAASPFIVRVLMRAMRELFNLPFSVCIGLPSFVLLP
jgi:hypothetical protein